MSFEGLRLNENESNEHFIYRVYRCQEDTGELTNEECGEICNRELKLEQDESAYRKKYQAFRSIFDVVKYELIDSERLKQIEDREERLYKEKVKTRDKLREYRKVKTVEARYEELLEMLIYAVNTIPPINFEKQDICIVGDNKAIFALGDLHYGKEYKNWWGSFNPQILKSRVQDLMYQILKYCKLMSIGELHIANLGDLIENNLHVTARVESAEDAIQQTIHVAELLGNLLSGLAGFGINIKYYSCLDNHSRYTMNFKEHIEDESLCKIIDWWLKERLKNIDNIEILDNEIDGNIGYFRVNQKNVFFCHGHLENVNTVVSDISTSIGIKPDYVILGHWHKSMMKPHNFSKVFINGSVAGVDTYAKDKRLFGYPSQTMIVFDGDNEIPIYMNLIDENVRRI